MRVYGIVNCNTVKAARAWLESQRASYEFVDFKKAPPTRDQLARWCNALGWKRVLNRRGTTWRTLMPAAQAQVKDQASAIALMLAKPAVIKRPVVEAGQTILIGFDADDYRAALDTSGR